MKSREGKRASNLPKTAADVCFPIQSQPFRAFSPIEMKETFPLRFVLLSLLSASYGRLCPIFSYFSPPFLLSFKTSSSLDPGSVLAGKSK